MKRLKKPANMRVCRLFHYISYNISLIAFFRTSLSMVAGPMVQIIFVLRIGKPPCLPAHHSMRSRPQFLRGGVVFRCAYIIPYVCNNASKNRPISPKFCLRQHHTNVSSGFSRSFPPEMRYFFLKYTKYSCEKLPFSDEKSQAKSSPPICAVLP